VIRIPFRTGASVAVGPAAAPLPDGLRVYAVGDVHGRFDRLQAVDRLIRDDLHRAPPESSLEIFLGDYIDRGPQSREVVEWLIAAEPATMRRVCLLGNHEDMLLGALSAPELLPHWLGNGGYATIESYLPVPTIGAASLSTAELCQRFAAALPGAHRTFLENLPRSHALGGFIFVHAGMRPGRALGDQDPRDLVWIREPFLSSSVDHGGIVVHGHTPVAAPDIRRNRINIDTGAVFGGPLTCLVLEGATMRFLQTGAD